METRAEGVVSVHRGVPSLSLSYQVTDDHAPQPYSLPTCSYLFLTGFNTITPVSPLSLAQLTREREREREREWGEKEAMFFCWSLSGTVVRFPGRRQVRGSQNTHTRRPGSVPRENASQFANRPPPFNPLLSLLEVQFHSVLLLTCFTNPPSLFLGALVILSLSWCARSLSYLVFLSLPYFVFASDWRLPLKFAYIEEKSAYIDEKSAYIGYYYLVSQSRSYTQSQNTVFNIAMSQTNATSSLSFILKGSFKFNVFNHVLKTCWHLNKYLKHSVVLLKTS